MSYPIETVLCSKNGYFTPDEARSYYGRYNRHGITWHWWGDGSGASNHDNIVNYLYGNSVRGVSSVNYVLSDAKITLMVGPDNVAFASQSGNPVSVSVELQPTLGAEGYKKAGWLAAQVAERYGGDRSYYPHNYWNATQCPGTISLDRIRQEEDKWQRGEYNAPAPAPTPAWNFVPKNGKAKISGTDGDGLWVLKSPQLSGQTVTVVNEGTIMDFVGYVTNGDSVNGNTKWWKNAFGNYFSAAYAPEYIPPAPTPEPTPQPIPEAEPEIKPVAKTIMYTLANAKLVDIKTLKPITPPSPFAIDTPIEVGGECTYNNQKFWLTQWATENKKAQGFLVGDLKANPEPAPAPAPAEPEWVANLRDIDDTKYWVTEDTQLIDITTGKPYLDKDGNQVILKKDEPFMCSALTAANKTEYRLTEYSFSRRIFNGVPINKLTLTEPGVPDISPIPDHPDYIRKSVVIEFLLSLVKIITDFVSKLKS